MKSWTFTLILVFSLNSFAQVDLKELENLTGSEETEDLLFQGSIDSYVDNFTDLINKIQLETDTGYVVAQTLVHDKCTVFMDKKHFLGTAGASIFKLLSEKPHLFPHIMAGGYAGAAAVTPVKPGIKINQSVQKPAAAVKSKPVVSLAQYCRKYPTMTAKQKALVWVLLMTVVAHFESSCNIKAAAKGPNGTAYGFYQLHKGKEDYYDGNRGLCAKNASSHAGLSSQCALSMIDMQLGRSQGQLFFNKSYWDVLRPNGSSKKAREIAKALSKFQLCNPVTL